MLYDHARPIARKFVAPDNVNANSKTPELFASTIFGPTCDGLDCVAKNVALPQMARDDWFIFDNMGAYTNVGGSEFNGMSRPTFEYVE
jgi:ornithine decarboxylase